MNSDVHEVKLRELLGEVYTDEQVEWLVSELVVAVDDFRKKRNERDPYDLTAADMALITYANSIEDESQNLRPLEALRKFLEKYRVGEVLPIVHLLPFYPWDTDRGFSVMDYREVKREYGKWDDIEKIGEGVKLMFDFVANHVSIDNPLVQGALIARHLPEDDERYESVKMYKDFVMAYDASDAPSDKDLAHLLRPRPNPVLTPYYVEDTGSGLRAKLGETTAEVLGSGLVWTTFSRGKRDDGSEGTRQVDLNFANPAVFLESIKVLLFYVEKGADLIRLDAIGYIWKKLGSTSMHEPQAHILLAAMDEVVSWAAPDVISVAEVNEPQDSVLTYLGSKKRRESDLVYQFSHFPLAVHAVLKGTTKYYREWLPTTAVFAGRQFTTVLGSHDGMGMKPVRGILPDEEIEFLTSRLVDEFGALPNYGKLPGGKEIVYEAVATPWNLINGPDDDEAFEVSMARYLAVVALGLLVRGIPAFYINGLIGAENYNPPDGLDENRTVNREIFDWSGLQTQLDDEDSRMRKVMGGVMDLLRKRALEPAFDPDAPELEVLQSEHDSLLSVMVPAQDPKKNLFVLINVSDAAQDFKVDHLSGTWQDVLSDIALEDSTLMLDPYQIVWLKVV